MLVMPAPWLDWVAVKEVKLSYYIGETLVFTICTHYGSLIEFLNSNPVEQHPNVLAQVTFPPVSLVQAARLIDGRCSAVRHAACVLAASWREDPARLLGDDGSKRTAP